MPRKKKENLSMKEAEIKRVEELNKREKKALEERAELIRRTKELEEAENGEEPEPTPEAPEGQGYAMSDRLAEVISQIQDDGKFQVFRIINGREQRVGNYSISDFPARLEEIAYECGGGTFKVVFRNGAGQYVQQDTQTFDPLFYKRKDDAPAVDHMSAGLPSILLEMQRQNAEMLNAMRRESMELMKTLLTNRSNPLQEVAALLPLMKSSTSEGALMEVLLKGLALGKEISSGESSSMLDKVLETVGRPFAETIAKVASNPAILKGQTPRPGVVRPGATPKPLPGSDVPAAPDPSIAKAKSHLFYRLYVPQILSAASKNAPVEAWAEKIADTVPESYHPFLIDIVEKPDLLDFISAYEPDAKTFGDWFTRLAKAVSDLFGPGDEESEDEGGEGAEDSVRPLDVNQVPVVANGHEEEVPEIVRDALSEPGFNE